MSLCPSIVTMRSCAARACPPAVKPVAIAMAAHATENGTVCASYAEIEEWSGISNHAVGRALQQLKEIGILTVIAGTFPCEKRTYRITTEVGHG